MRRVKHIIHAVKQATGFDRRYLANAEAQPLIIEMAPDEQSGDASFREISTHLRSLILSKENSANIIIASFLTILSIALNYVTPYLMGKAFDSSTEEQSSTLKTDVILSTIFFIVSQLAPIYREQVLASISACTTEKILAEIARKSLLEKTLEHHISASNTDQTFILQKGFSVSNTVRPLLTQILPTMIEIVTASSIIATQYSFRAAVFLTLMLASSAGFGIATAPSIIKLSEENQRVGKKTWNALSETLTAYKAIHDSHASSHQLMQARDGTKRMAQIQINQTKLDVKTHCGQILISGLFVMTTLLFTDCTTLPKKDLFILAAYLQQFVRLIPSFGQTISSMMVSYPDLKLVIGELMKPSQVKDDFSTVELITKKDMPPSIAFRDVSFHYRGRDKERKTVIEQVSFVIKSGQRVALVSESGRGKSTLFNLLFRYYEPKSGMICVDDQDISRVGLTHLRDKMSIVEQSPTLFGNTLRENIVGVCSTAHDEKIIAAATKMGLFEFIHAFDNGLDTETGERGAKLSGGQKQKVAILRSMYRDAPILLLDEATSALDATSAASFMSALRGMDKTIIAITHKLSEIQDFDRIIVLNEDGSITQGTHAELLRSSAPYKKLWDSQASYSEHSSRLFSAGFGGDARAEVSPQIFVQ